MRIIVGMSGGVDSSVTALLLKEQGYEVIGVSMKIWNKEYSTETTRANACFDPNEKEDLAEAKRVCDTLGIPFYSFDCTRDFDDIILAYFREEYLAGRTPNPCVKCNHLMKFNILIDKAKRSGVDFDFFATGHYAKVEYNEKQKRYILKKARDWRKDQTYFLYHLTQKQLAHALFPLGDYFKEEVRGIAWRKGLPVHDKSESQDFYSGDYQTLLKVPAQKGNIVDKNGIVLGQHTGFWNYTFGQRRRLGISSSRPLYVIGINKERNEVVVGFKEDTYKNGLIAEDIHWISIARLSQNMNVAAKLRSTHTGVDATIKPVEEDAVSVIFRNPQKSISPGQSVVFYDDDVVVGGGIIHG